MNWESFFEDEEIDCSLDEFAKKFRDEIESRVKKDIQDELSRLRAENAELQQVKANWDNLNRKVESERTALALERKGLLDKFNREKIEEILGSFPVNGFVADYRFEQPPKCDKCNANRQIPYTSPRGFQKYEDCACKEFHRVYYPNPVAIASIRFHKGDPDWGEDPKLTARAKYTFCQDSESEKSFTLRVVVENVEEAMSIRDKIGYGEKIIFTDRAECKKYCDILAKENKS